LLALRATLGMFSLVVSGLASATAAQVGVPAPAPQQLPVTPAQVLAHLNRTVDWYRHLSTLEQSSSLSGDALARDRLYQTSVTAVQSAFDFADAAATVLGSTSGAAGAASASDSSDDAARLDRVAARMATRVTSMQSRLNDLDAQLAKAPPAARAALSAQRARAAASLTLALEVQKTVLELQRFATSSAAGAAGGGTSLRAQIEELQRSVPEARRASGPAGRTASSAAATPDSGVRSRAVTATPTSLVTIGPSSPGLLPLASQWLALRSIRRQLTEALAETDALSTELDTLRLALGRQVRTLVRANLADTTPVAPDQLGAAQRQIEAATIQFRRLSTVLVPLGEQDITVDDARGTLAELRVVLRSRSAGVLQDLSFRAALLIAAITLVLAISELWRRATFRYLKDARRRRQFLLLRRVAVAIALVAIIVFGFMSEIGSLATYAGFLTAGLAVALQNVILAVVAYFFLIGRYGVRVGDRVTLAGVTGRVVDIGLIRLYLMELAGPELQATGRMVVMSNAVLFKPEALFKQIPGAEYVWHTVTLSLAPTTDASAVRGRLKAAADSVYARWRPAIEAQHAAVQRMVDFDASVPEPRVDVRFTEQAFEFTVRYPVLAEQAAANDQLMMKTLRDAVASEAQVVVDVVAGAPR